ncbi:hypothetical protein PILCRDRAFT_16346 [Piloderma croceum F 1598]|uniref:Uncharacterized protein n=1 Tax=Piloderma croceum (strain F 1598) TaxID=765440 RepID=A0A0C3EWS5_PILCF|nr:hypothetical protein PILCRDRAFT_16346 [Piloderma croceum F 1598]
MRLSRPLQARNRPRTTVTQPISGLQGGLGVGREGRGVGGDKRRSSRSARRGPVTLRHPPPPPAAAFQPATEPRQLGCGFLAQCPPCLAFHECTAPPPPPPRTHHRATPTHHPP